MWPTSSFEH